MDRFPLSLTWLCRFTLAHLATLRLEQKQVNGNGRYLHNWLYASWLASRLTGTSDATLICYGLPMTDLTPIESELATSEDAAAYDAWFYATVERADGIQSPAHLA